MRKLIFLVFGMGVLAACAQTPKIAEKDWKLEKGNPDQKLNVDEQFLLKSQQPFYQPSVRKTSHRSFL